MARLSFAGAQVDCAPGETVLAALLRHGLDVPYSCRNGVCMTCLLRAREGPVPDAAQVGLKETLRAEGHLLACLCTPTDDLTLALPDDAEIFGRALVRGVEPLAPAIMRVTLEPATPLYYHAGQFINLRRADGLVRSYSLASVPRLDPLLELHVKRLPRGAMSGWVFDTLTPGTAVDIQGPNGTCFYVPGRPSQKLLLIGNGSGLAPLIGIARDALASGHEGEIHLYHGSRTAAGLYLGDTLRALAAAERSFTYVPCVSGDAVPAEARVGRAEVNAFADHPRLDGWRVFLCGYPPMVKSARRQAYLAGADLADIFADPFELRDLRRRPRD